MMQVLRAFSSKRNAGNANANERMTLTLKTKIILNILRSIAKVISFYDKCPNRLPQPSFSVRHLTNKIPRKC